MTFSSVIRYCEKVKRFAGAGVFISWNAAWLILMLSKFTQLNVFHPPSTGSGSRLIDLSSPALSKCAYRMHLLQDQFSYPVKKVQYLVNTGLIKYAHKESNLEPTD